MTTDAQQVTFGFCTSGTNGITMSIGACFSEVHSGFPAGKTLMNDSNGNGLLFINFGSAPAGFRQKAILFPHLLQAVKPCVQ